MPLRLLMTAALLAAVCVAGVTGGDAQAAQTPTVKLLTAKVAREYPGHNAPAVRHVPARRPLTGAPTVLPVYGRADANGRPWVRVLLPNRPNEQTGWIAADGTVSGRTPWKVTIGRGARTATVTRNGRTVRRLSVVVGTAATPTPLGRFFVAERVRQPHGAAIGPWALATSAYSNVLQQFGGGPGQIALHGRTGLSDPLGTAASHGCVRFADTAIRWLARRAAAGTPIIIKP